MNALKAQIASALLVSGAFVGLLYGAGCGGTDTASTASTSPTAAPSTRAPGTASPTTTQPPPASPSATQHPASPTPPAATPTARPLCTITPGTLPFERTECRATCDHYDPLKQPFFGETHLHTAYSFDASTLDTRNLPPDAYRYAKGDVVGLPPWADTRSGTPTPGYDGPDRW